MTDRPAPGERRRLFAQFVKRDLPERAAVSKWCGKHEKERTRLLVRRVWVCLDCVADRGRSA